MKYINIIVLKPKQYFVVFKNNKTRLQVILINVDENFPDHSIFILGDKLFVDVLSTYLIFMILYVHSLDIEVVNFKI